MEDPTTVLISRLLIKQKALDARLDKVEASFRDCREEQGRINWAISLLPKSKQKTSAEDKGASEFTDIGQRLVFIKDLLRDKKRAMTQEELFSAQIDHGMKLSRIANRKQLERWLTKKDVPIIKAGYGRYIYSETKTV